MRQNQKSLLNLSKKIFQLIIFSFSLLSGSLFFFTKNSFAQKEDNLSLPPETVEMNRQIEEQVLSDPEFMAEVNKSSFSPSLIMILWTVLGIFMMVIFIYGLKTKKIKLKADLSKLKGRGAGVKVDHGMMKRDEKRKETIKKIQEKLAEFYGKNQRYPSSEEFKEIRKKYKDPMEGKDTAVMGQKYGIYYDNQYTDETENPQQNNQYYKLWCLVENPNDSEAQHYYNNTLHFYMKTSQDMDLIKEEKEQAVHSVSPASNTSVQVSDQNNVKVAANQATVNFEQNTPSPEKIRDLKRKENIKKIREKLNQFYQVEKRYPTREEYQTLLQQIIPLPQDPRLNEETGFNSQKFGYYYDNLILDQSSQTKDDYQTYRLWCLLEDVTDGEIKHEYDSLFHWLYLKTETDQLS